MPLNAHVACEMQRDDRGAPRSSYIAAMQTSTDRDAILLVIFDGVRSHFHSWRWSFERFLMAKYPSLVDLLASTYSTCSTL